MMTVKNKTALITGGTRGIGEQLAYEFAKRGYSLSLCSRSEDDCLQISNRLRKEFPGIDVYAATCDMRSREAIEFHVLTTVRRLGGIDVLINNAGLGRFGALDEMSVDDLDDILWTNLRGAILMTKQALPAICRNEAPNRGVIVFIGSSCDEKYVPGNSFYAVSKAGLRIFADYIFQEYRTQGIYTTYVSAGSVDTSFSNRFSDDPRWKISAMDVARAISQFVDVMYVSNGMCISSVDLRTMTPRKTQTDKE